MLAQQTAQRQGRRRLTRSSGERISCMNLQPTITEAIAEHLTVIQQLTAMSSLILQVANELVATLRRQGKVVLCGNGGSASDAQHIAAEMQGYPRASRYSSG